MRLSDSARLTRAVAMPARLMPQHSLASYGSKGPYMAI